MTSDRLPALLHLAHMLTAETDRVAAQIATELGVNPSDDLITEIVWNMADTAAAVAVVADWHKAARGVDALRANTRPDQPFPEPRNHDEEIANARAGDV